MNITSLPSDNILDLSKEDANKISCHFAPLYSKQLSDVLNSDRYVSVIEIIQLGNSYNLLELTPVEFIGIKLALNEIKDT